MDELQAAMLVIPSEVAYVPKFTYIWTLAVVAVPRRAAGRRVARETAVREIARCFLTRAGMTVPGELARVSGLPRPEAGLGNRALVAEGVATMPARGVYVLAPPCRTDYIRPCPSRHAAIVSLAALLLASGARTARPRPASAPRRSPASASAAAPCSRWTACASRTPTAAASSIPTKTGAGPVEARVRDLVGRMTLEEKAGLMLIDTLNAGCGGALTPAATAFVETQKMTRFMLRNVVKADRRRL